MLWKLLTSDRLWVIVPSPRKYYLVWSSKISLSAVTWWIGVKKGNNSKIGSIYQSFKLFSDLSHGNKVNLYGWQIFLWLLVWVIATKEIEIMGPLCFPKSNI
jgi:hypothetical protein